jgi:mono/diheme cytochrome c family protein
MKMILWITAIAFAITLFDTGTGSSQTNSDIERGKYLVENAAMCVQCHSPRDTKGELIQGKLLSGARVPLASPWPGEKWAAHAPKIAGLPGWIKEDFVTLLMTGKRPTGEIPRAPMPPFRMTREDAEAIADYLKSLR